MFACSFDRTGRYSCEPAQSIVVRYSSPTDNLRTDSDDKGITSAVKDIDSLGNGRTKYQPAFLHLNSSRLVLPSNQHEEGQGHVPKGTKRNKSRARVLLVSYMRSGSSFAGDIFQSVPGVFYLYEPLLYVEDNNDMVPEKISLG